MVYVHYLHLILNRYQCHPFTDVETALEMVSDLPNRRVVTGRAGV